MKITVLQHVPFEGIALIADWGYQHGHTFSICRLWQEKILLPTPKDVEMLVIMGGPMSVSNEGAHTDYPNYYSGLQREKEFIKEVIDQRKHVLGICLGCQLIASALGARTYPNSVKEIGWFPITICNEALGQPLLFDLDATLKAFHWHSDTFDLPQGASLLMSSVACRNQAFVVKDRVLGLQFHLEMTKDSIKNIIANCKSDINQSKTIQSEDELLAGCIAIPICKQTLFLLLDGLLKQ